MNMHMCVCYLSMASVRIRNKLSTYNNFFIPENFSKIFILFYKYFMATSDAIALIIYYNCLNDKTLQSLYECIPRDIY